MPIDDISYTTQPSAESNGRYITVYAPDGSYVSRHNNMEECTESAINYAEANGLEGDLVFRFVPPEKHMRLVKKAIILPPPVQSTFTAQGGAGNISTNGQATTISVTAPPTGGDPYDLYASDTQSRGIIPFAVNWPTEPTITSTATVTPATFSANNVNGREITLTSGAYGNISISGTDKTLILQSGASIGLITLQGQRIKIVGQAGSLIGQVNHNSGGTDVLLDGISSNAGSWELWDPTRMALINSSLTNAGWSFFVQWNPANAKPVDIIVAGNTILASSLSPVRVENVERFILVDNQLRSRDGFASLRIHQEGDSNQDFWVRNNQFENLTDNGRWQFGPNDGQPRTMSNAYFYDNAVYGSNSYLATAPTLTYSNLNAERNYIYSDIETSGDWLVPPASGSGNTAQGGYVTPPAWNGVAVP